MKGITPGEPCFPILSDLPCMGRRRRARPLGLAPPPRPAAGTPGAGIGVLRIIETLQSGGRPLIMRAHEYAHAHASCMPVLQGRCRGHIREATAIIVHRYRPNTQVRCDSGWPAQHGILQHGMNTTLPCYHHLVVRTMVLPRVATGTRPSSWDVRLLTGSDFPSLQVAKCMSKHQVHVCIHAGRAWDVRKSRVVLAMRPRAPMHVHGHPGLGPKSRVVLTTHPGLGPKPRVVLTTHPGSRVW